MLKDSHRLRRMKDFEVLSREGRSVSAPVLSLKVWKIDPAKYPKRDYTTADLKIGFVVSTKVAKSAVKRNRVKRQMRETMRLLIKSGAIPEGYILAFFARPTIIDKSYEEISSTVIGLLRRANLIK